MTVILIIEDEPLIRQNTAEALELFGYSVLLAENGASGIQMVTEYRPDLIICDIMMPESDGYSVLQALQSDPATATVPFIFMSALADRKSVRRGMEVGADDYITKPFTSQELVTAVQTRLAKASTAAAFYQQHLEQVHKNPEQFEGAASPPDGDAQELIGRTLHGYQFWDKIGEGGVGIVYQAYQPAIGRDVAIKVLRPKYARNPEFLRRFETEAELVARLEHPHIIPLYDYWNSDEKAFLVMRLVRGGSLRTAIETQRQWPLTHIARLLDQVADALSVAHSYGIIHRDLKPDNILLDERQNAYLTDFGLAKHLVDFPAGRITDPTQLLSILADKKYADEQGVTLHLTDDDVLVGTPAYLSPEQLLGNTPSIQSDIYSLGMTLYELLVGQPPFLGTTAAVVMQQLSASIPSVHAMRDDVPDKIDKVLQIATDKDWNNRYPDVLTLAEEFRKSTS